MVESRHEHPYLRLCAQTCLVSECTYSVNKYSSEHSKERPMPDCRFKLQVLKVAGHNWDLLKGIGYA